MMLRWTFINDLNNYSRKFESLGIFELVKIVSIQILGSLSYKIQVRFDIPMLLLVVVLLLLAKHLY